MKFKIGKRLKKVVGQRRFIRYAVLVLNVVFLGGIIAFAIHSNDTDNKNRLLTSKVRSGGSTNPLDQLSSADIAVNLAQMANVRETTAVINQADSVGAELSAPVAQASVITKPQAVTTDLKSRKDIKQYVVAQGDTIASVAAKFNVTSESISWSNNITNGQIQPGSTIYVPPVNGIVYTVKGGDTPDALAQKFQASKDLIVASNDAELTGLVEGMQILIPNGRQPAPVVARARGASTSAGSGGYYRFSYGYNGYDYGFCTWYVANRRAQAGNPIPAGLGNASSWDNRAPAAGLSVGRKPAVGAAAVTSQSGWGHVVFVEVLTGDGGFWGSEMNSRGQVSMTNTAPAGGWGRVDWKYFPPDRASSFGYVY